MRRYLFALFALAFTAWAANFKLYLKDGTYQIVREYKVQSDRIRYYSVERSDWEEIPSELVDLKRTETEASERKAELEKDAKILSEEDKVQREMQKEVMRIPQDPGVYWLDGKKAMVLKAAEASVRTNKGRSILAKIAPVPMVSGQGNAGTERAPIRRTSSPTPSRNSTSSSREAERFGIAKLTSKGQVRIVENLTFMPVTKEVEEELTLVGSFQKELTQDGLYKVWPKEPLEPGEYAVVQYTAGKMNVQVFDFAIKK